MRAWTLEVNQTSALGHLEVGEGALIYSVHALHGALGELARRRLIEQVARRAAVAARDLRLAAAMNLLATLSSLRHTLCGAHARQMLAAQVSSTAKNYCKSSRGEHG